MAMGSYMQLGGRFSSSILITIAVLVLFSCDEANSACWKTSELGFSLMKPCKPSGTHNQDSQGAFITSYHQKLTWCRGSTFPQNLLVPHRPSGRVILRGPSFGSLRGSFNFALRASTSSGPDPSVQMANANLERARQSLSRKQNILDVANQALDSLLMKKPRPSPSEIAEAKRDFAEAERDVAKAERDVAEAVLKSFLINHPRPSSSDAAATRDFDVEEGRLQRDVAKAERDVAEAVWNLSKADLAFAQARNAPDIDLEQKRKEEELFRVAFERLVMVTALSPGLKQTGLASTIEEIPRNVTDMTEFNKRKLPEHFVPLLNPLPPLTNPLPEEVAQFGGFMDRPPYDKYFTAAKEEAMARRQALIAFTGSPGIGKSFFYLYFALQLILEKLGTYIIMGTMTFEKNLLVWDVAKGKVYTYEPENAFKVINLLSNEAGAWLLVDGPNKERQFHDIYLEKGKTIWFLSPNEKIINPLQAKANTKVYYMPDWTFEELEICNQGLYKISEEHLRERYDYFGGIPRYVFGKSQKALKSLVEEALKKCDIIHSAENLAEKNAFLDEYSHKLLILQPEGLDEYKLAFASPHIRAKIIQNYRANGSKKLLEFISLAKDDAILAGVRGQFFEDIAHDELCKGGKFTAKNLISGENTMIPLDKRVCSWYYMKKEKMIYESAVGEKSYSRPRAKNQGGYDSFYDNYFFQMTVSGTKQVNLKFIEDNLQQRGVALPSQMQRAVTLVIVVADVDFDDFIKVSFEYHTKEAKDWAKYIEQYVLAIPIESKLLEALGKTPEEKAKMRKRADKKKRKA